MQKRPKMRFPKPVAEFFREGLRGTALGERLRDADIWRVWPDVVGQAIASRAAPLRIINGTLTVAVSNGPWMQELSFLKEMIKDKLNLTLGSEIVKDIILKSGKAPKPDLPVEEAEPMKISLTDSQLRQIDSQASLIQDEETRAAFVELMRTSLQTVHPGAVRPRLVTLGKQ